MRIIILARIHANLPALEAILAEMEAHHWDALWVIGDWITHGPHPAEVIERLRPLCTLGVIGQGDQAVLQCAGSEEEATTAFSAACWSYHQLTRAQRRYLRLLSSSLRFKLEGRRFLLTQGHTLADGEALRHELPTETWLRIFKQAQADVLVVSSGEKPFVHRLGELLCINVGAVGYPQSEQAEASYACLTLAGGDLQVEFRRVPYALQTVWEACQEAGLPLFPPLGQAELDPGSLPESNQQAYAENEPGLDRRLLPVLELVRTRNPEEDEARLLTVSHLAMQLFDQLQPLHHLGREERFWLECAALLHSLERSRHPRSYPRRALPIILNTTLLPFDSRERLLIGSLVRYQQKRPRKKHQNYALLKAEERSKVQILAALLRLALAIAENGTAIEDLYGEITPRKVKLKLITHEPAETLQKEVKKRGRRLAHLFGRKLRVKVLSLESPPPSPETTEDR